jgi:hypothetical protein
MFGIGTLPKCRRKDKLAAALDGVLELFTDRILPFDIGAGRRYADLAVKARAAGKGFLTPDGYIAAIAASHEFVVAIPRHQRVYRRRSHRDRPLDRRGLSCGPPLAFLRCGS